MLAYEASFLLLFGIFCFSVVIMLCAISEMEVLWIILWAIYDILYGYIWYTVSAQYV